MACSVRVSRRGAMPSHHFAENAYTMHLGQRSSTDSVQFATQTPLLSTAVLYTLPRAYSTLCLMAAHDARETIPRERLSPEKL